MKVLSWNVRDLGNVMKRVTVKKVVLSQRPDVLFSTGDKVLRA